MNSGQHALWRAMLLSALLTSCSDDPTNGFDAGAAPDSGPGTDASSDPGLHDASADAGGTFSLRVMTMNIGTTPGLAHDDGDDAYTQEMADIADALYENSLSWNPAEVALTAFIAGEAPDIIAFQEGFWDPWCETIEVDPELDFVCRDYEPSRTKQVLRVTGPEFQAACGDGQEDNCVAVRRSVGRIVGCDEDVCAGGLEGAGPPSECSRGARVGRVEVELADARRLVVVNVHGTSGFTADDQNCRRDQFAQIFEDRGDGQPAANGERNLVIGDLNTDPIALELNDPSAAYFLEKIESTDFQFHSPTERNGPATYLTLRIDHVVSDFAEGGCLIHGSSDGTNPVLDSVYWDHRPVLCDLTF